MTRKKEEEVIPTVNETFIDNSAKAEVPNPPIRVYPDATCSFFGQHDVRVSIQSVAMGLRGLATLLEIMTIQAQNQAQQNRQ